MLWLIAAISFVLVVILYTAIINRTLLRCPHCGKIGSWRFDDLAPPVEELDDEGDLVQSSQRQACRRCGGEVERVWSDGGGVEIRKFRPGLARKRKRPIER